MLSLAQHKLGLRPLKFELARTKKLNTIQTTTTCNAAMFEGSRCGIYMYIGLRCQTRQYETSINCSFMELQPLKERFSEKRYQMRKNDANIVHALLMAMQKWQMIN